MLLAKRLETWDPQSSDPKAQCVFSLLLSTETKCQIASDKSTSACAGSLSPCQMMITTSRASTPQWPTARGMPSASAVIVRDTMEDGVVECKELAR